MVPLLWFWHNVLFSNWAKLVCKKDKNYLATIILRHPDKKFCFSFTKLIFLFSIFLFHFLFFLFSYNSYFELKIPYSSVCKHSLGIQKIVSFYILVPCFLLLCFTARELFTASDNFRGGLKIQRRRMSTSLGAVVSSHSGPCPLCFWVKMSPDTYYKNPYITQMQIFVWSRAFGRFLKGNWEITCYLSRKEGMEYYTSLLASTSVTIFCLWLDNFAMSFVRFAVPRKPSQCRTALPVIWFLSNTSVLCLGRWDLALNSWACLWSHTMFASAVAVCFRALLVPTWYWISRLLVGKERP